MDKTALVSIDIAQGEMALAAMDAANIGVCVAVFVYLSAYDDWRLVIASKSLDSDGPQQRYLRVNDAMMSAGIGSRQAPSVMIMKTTDPFVRDLRKVFGKAKSVEGMRLGGQSFGDRYVEDGFAYRIS